MNMQFEWDENKNRSNYRKHGVWFEEAQTIWIASESVEFFDPEHSSNEEPFYSNRAFDERSNSSRRILREGGGIDHSHYLRSKNNSDRNECL